MLNKILGWIKGERSEGSDLQVEIEMGNPESLEVLPMKDNESAPKQPDPVCPHCGYLLQEMPKRKRKCPHCRNEVVVRTDRGIKVLMTTEESRRLDTEKREALEKERLFNLLHSCFNRESPEETSLRLEAKRKELSQSYGRELTDGEVVWDLLNEARTAAKPNDLVRLRPEFSMKVLFSGTTPRNDA